MGHHFWRWLGWRRTCRGSEYVGVAVGTAQQQRNRLIGWEVASGELKATGRATRRHLRRGTYSL